MKRPGTALDLLSRAARPASARSSRGVFFCRPSGRVSERGWIVTPNRLRAAREKKALLSWSQTTAVVTGTSSRSAAPTGSSASSSPGRARASAAGAGCPLEGFYPVPDHGFLTEPLSEVERALRIDPDLAYANIVRAEFAVRAQDWAMARRPPPADARGPRPGGGSEGASSARSTGPATVPGDPARGGGVAGHGGGSTSADVRDAGGPSHKIAAVQIFTPSGTACPARPRA